MRINTREVHVTNYLVKNPKPTLPVDKTNFYFIQSEKQIPYTTLACNQQTCKPYAFFGQKPNVTFKTRKFSSVEQKWQQNTCNSKKSCMF